MKLMNKVVAAISAMTMAITMFASVSYAGAGDVLTLKATSDAVKAGETAQVTVSLENTAAEGLIAFTVDFTFADGFVVPAIADTTGYAFADAAGSAVNTSVVVGTNKYRFDWSDDLADTASTGTGKLFTLGVQVPEGTAPGQYPITATTNYIADFAWNEDLTVALEGAYIEVISDAVEAKIAPNEPIDGVKEVKEDGNTYFTKGLSATLTPGTETVTNVIATFFNKAGNEGKEKAEWAGSYSGATPITFAVNVLNVPDGEDVTATWEIVK